MTKKMMNFVKFRKAIFASKKHSTGQKSITMKLNPDIIIKMMEMDVDEKLLKYFIKFFNKVIIM